MEESMKGYGMNGAADYRKIKKNAAIFMGVGIAVMILGTAFLLVAGALFLDAGVKAGESREKEEVFDPFRRTGLESSYQTMDIIGLSYDFAEDFKGTYHYYLAFTNNLEIRVIKMKGEFPEEMEPLADYLLYGGKEPEPVTIRGTAAVMEDDIKEYALQALNVIGGEGFLDRQGFDQYVGQCYLDLTRKPVGYGDREGAMGMLSAALICLFSGGFLLVFQIKRRGQATAALEREKRGFADARMYRQAAEGEELEEEAEGEGISPGAEISKTGGCEAETCGAGAYEAEFTKPAGENQWKDMEEKERTGQKGNMVLGILGAIGGSLIGVGLWILIGFANFIAGIAGFVMLKFALKGYQKGAGKLDRRGALICLVIAAFMIPAANVLECFILLCQAFFAFEVSMDTVRYVAVNFSELMTDCELWPMFFKDLIIGYGLSIWSSYKLIGGILTYKE